MLGKIQHFGATLFEQPLSEVLNSNKPLYQLADKIDWDFIEENLSKFYSKKVRPSHPIRLMAGLLILKSLRDLSDETLVDEQWEENGFYQYFCGAEFYQSSKPCASSDLVHFRKRIGEQGVKIILKASIDIHDKPSGNKDEIAYADTTVQEKNITFPTDAKLHKKIIAKCNNIAKKEGIKLKNNFKKKSQKLLQSQHNRNHPKRWEQAIIASKELKRIAGVIVRDLERKLTTEKHTEDIEIFKKILRQEKSSKNKIYSIHEPDIHCIGKGKAHKKYEFGSKFGILWSQSRGIILSGFDSRNQYDGDSLNGLVENYYEINDTLLKEIYCDRGYRGAKIENTIIQTPKPPLKRDSESAKRKKRKHFRARAGIEPVISHLKHDFRMGINLLKGKIGDAINGLMACAAFNFKKWMKSFSFAHFSDLKIALKSIIFYKSIIRMCGFSSCKTFNKFTGKLKMNY